MSDFDWSGEWQEVTALPRVFMRLIRDEKLGETVAEFRDEQGKTWRQNIVNLSLRYRRVESRS